MQNAKITEMTGEKLAAILAEQYETLMLTQQNITAIRQELERRQQEEVTKNGEKAEKIKKKEA